MVFRIEDGGKGNEFGRRFKDTKHIGAVAPAGRTRRKGLTQTMEMRHLRLVQTLAVEGTLTAAGKRLYLTQSALSHQLREIEDEFGIKLFDDEMVAIVRGDHRWASRSYVGAKQFADEHLIGYDIPFEEVVFNKQVLQPAGITPQSLLKLPTTDAIIEMVKAGMGVAVMNLWSVRPYLESLDLRALRLTRNGYQRTWYAAVPNGGKQPPFISHFIGFLTLSQN